MERKLRGEKLVVVGEAISFVAGQPKMTSAKLRLMVKQLLERLSAPIPTWSARIAAGGTYAVSLLVGFGTVAGVGFAQSGDELPEVRVVRCHAGLTSQIVDDSPPAWLELQARFSDPALVEGALSDVSLVGRQIGDGCVRSPWSESAPDDRTSELAARRTYSALQDEMLRLLSESPLDPFRQDASVAEARAAAIEAVRGSAPWVDEDVVDLFEAADPMEPSATAEDRLLETLGGTACAVDNIGYTGAHPGRAPNSIAVVVNDPPDMDDAELAFAYLCGLSPDEVTVRWEMRHW